MLCCGAQSRQLDDHHDTNPSPSSLTHPITCMTEGRFSSGGSPIEDEDLLLTTSQTQGGDLRTSVRWVTEHIVKIKGSRITCRFRLTLNHWAASCATVVYFWGGGSLHSFETRCEPREVDSPHSKPNLVVESKSLLSEIDIKCIYCIYLHLKWL